MRQVLRAFLIISVLQLAMTLSPAFAQTERDREAENCISGVCLWDKLAKFRDTNWNGFKPPQHQTYTLGTERGKIPIVGLTPLELRVLEKNLAAQNYVNRYRKNQRMLVAKLKDQKLAMPKLSIITSLLSKIEVICRPSNFQTIMRGDDGRQVNIYWMPQPSQSGGWQGYSVAIIEKWFEFPPHQFPEWVNLIKSKFPSAREVRNFNGARGIVYMKNKSGGKLALMIEGIDTAEAEFTKHQKCPQSSGLSLE